MLSVVSSTINNPKRKSLRVEHNLDFVLHSVAILPWLCRKQHLKQYSLTHCVADSSIHYALILSRPFGAWTEDIYRSIASDTRPIPYSKTEWTLQILIDIRPSVCEKKKKKMVLVVLRSVKLSHLKGIGSIPLKFRLSIFSSEKLGCY